MLEAGFVWNGRLGRLAYFGYSMLLGLILGVIALVLILPLRNSPNAMTVGIVVGSVLVLIGLYSGFCLAAKRLHDVNLSGWHYVWMVLAPWFVNLAGQATHQVALSIFGGLVNLGAGLFLLFWPGTQGENNYGYQP